MTTIGETASSGPTGELQPLLKQVERAREELIHTTRALVRIPTETPPSDTSAAVQLITELLSGVDGVQVRTHLSEPPISNLVAKVTANSPGKRLILNGHLDTYPAGDHSSWSDNPFSGEIRDGKIFGRGSADMKGGVACLLYVFKTLAQQRDRWVGELCLTLAGDEESMGTLGSQFLLETAPDAHGDAMMNADVGSPIVPRIGEKGMIWIDVFAEGNPAHGAHVHRGENAINRLRLAMDALSQLSSYPINTPDDVAETIERALVISEPLGGEGEARVLQQITVNFGRLEGGQTANLVPDWAELNADIRLPMGVSVSEIEAEIHRLLDPLQGVAFEIKRRYEPTWTSPSEPIVAATLDACERVLGKRPVANMRVGASDARLYRAAGIPTVVCGLTPHNLGGPDEYVEIDELVDVTKIHLLTALNFLSGKH